MPKNWKVPNGPAVRHFPRNCRFSDAEKIAWLKETRLRQATPGVRERYEAATDDEAVDPLTRSLLRWFTDVENDSVVRMGAVYAEIEKAG